MKRSKSSQSALLTSILSLILCCAMLVSTTFAWFTDSVTTGTNRIVAGNLDIELIHSNRIDTDEPVGSDTVLFDDVARWEPGAYCYENFTITNAGSLALKYDFAFNTPEDTDYNFVVDAAGVNTGRSLLDVLCVKVVEGSVASTRPAYAVGEGITLKAFLSGSKIDLGTLKSGESKDIGVMLYWPENGENDNDFNLKNGAHASDAPAGEVGALFVNLGIQLSASQHTYEEDSFNNQYDYIDGVYELPAFSVSAPVVTDESGTAATEDIRLSEYGVTAVIPAENVDPNADAYRLDVEPTDVSAAGVVIGDGQQRVGYDIHVTKIQGDTETPVNGEAATFEILIGKGFYAVKAYHNGDLIPSDYNAATGVISFAVDSFSPFDFVISPDQSQHAVALIRSGDTAVTAKNSNELRVAIANAAAGSTVVLLDDIVVENTTEHTGSTIYPGDKTTASLGNLIGITFDGNGHTITAESDKYIFCDVKESTVKNVTLALNGETPILWTADATFEKVVTKGEVSVSGNQSAFVVYAWLAPLTMIDCVNEATLSGTAYNSVFVGYPYGADLTFRNCVNKGSLVGDYSAMFIANPAGSISNTITIENCRNEGLIHTIITTNKNRIPNLFAAVSSSLAKHTVVLNGVTYTNNEILSQNTAALGMGNPISFGQEDPTLAVARNNAERTFVVTLASELDVAEYELQYITYPKRSNGTQMQVIRERFAAPTEGETYVSKVRYFDFVDSAWVENNPSAVQSTLEGHTVYTLNGMTYYLLPNPDGAYFTDHVPNPGDVCQLDAYDAAGVKIASVSFTITNGEISSKK